MASDHVQGLAESPDLRRPGLVWPALGLKSLGPLEDSLTCGSNSHVSWHPEKFGEPERPLCLVPPWKVSAPEDSSRAPSTAQGGERHVPQHLCSLAQLCC